MKKFARSLSFAVAGIIHAVESQRHMRFHIVASLFALGLGLYLRVNYRELLFIFMAITLVIMAELFNTAIEAAIDLFTNETHPLARVAKNVAAGAVLVTAVNALVVAYLIFFPRLEGLIIYSTPHFRRAPIQVTVPVLLLVALAVVAAKVLARKVPLLKKGLPSGQTALAFAGATALLLLTGNATVSTIALLMALITAHGRLAAGTHSVLEVVAGALIGILTTLAAFQLAGW
ncbi:MAG: diacylglycerol kinase [Firmicutes bacterium]|nr:diacylglycerol kinase [Bacillota bacterium]